MKYLWLLLFIQPAWAQEETSLPSVRVFGSDGYSLEQPQSPQKVGREKFETYQYTDVNRALKQTSGVYVREEDGQGLRPNIGLRGTNPDRSKKVVLMEDGVLIGPAPYSAPAAYFTPDMNHVESLEIYKGFAAVGYGPNSVGGAVNYISSSIPSEPMYEARTTLGTFGTANTRLRVAAPTTFGGYLFEVSDFRSDGFKNIDGGSNAGFHKNGALGKLRWHFPGGEPGSHYLEARLGYERETSHETYLGLAPDDFSATPYRRYASSALDEMKWNQDKIQLAHVIRVGESGVVETTLYHHRFHRAWYRLDGFQDGSRRIRNILNDPSSDPSFYDVLRGTLDSTMLGAGARLVVVNNDRTYRSQGLQSQFTTQVVQDGWSWEPGVFLRLHDDQIERNHTSDRYEMQSGRLARTADATVTDTRNIESTQAATLSAQSAIKWGDAVLTPVVRFETAEFRMQDSLNATKNGRRNDKAVVPGFSYLHRIGDTMSARASVNRAATMAGLSVTGQEVKEIATNYEAEFKWRDPGRAWEGDVTAFFSDYENLTETCTVSGGCTSGNLDTAFSGGKAKVYGLESRLGRGYQAGRVYVPVQANVTLLEAVFDSYFTSTSPTWGEGAIRAGDPLPYIPRLQFALSVGAEWSSWKQEITWMHQSSVYDQSASTSRREIAGFEVLDWAGSYQFSPQGRITARVDNLLGRKYAVSARPMGLRPGKPQSFHLGLVYRF